MLHTVVETPEYRAQAEREGLTAAERIEIVNYLSKHPTAGDVIPGTGGARKVRFAGRGKGKSGGYRLITHYADADIPVFLLSIYGKDQMANITDKQKNAFRSMLMSFPTLWRTMVKQRVRERRKRK